uniref:Uncharacterized protein n=1 Tax=viral metagenome TaxID=1070528 RepID=A0A6M3KE88_9ZZZZ
MSMVERAIEEKVPYWICPDCKTVYFGAVSPFRFCPKCREESERKKVEYWAGVVEKNKPLVQNILAKYLTGAQK